MNLINYGKFQLRSGLWSPYKLDCDAFAADDWVALAQIVVEHLEIEFSAVEGVPKGGLAFARALSRYCQQDGGLLIVDDVFTTGKSMEQQRNERPAQGVVVFARTGRKFCPEWIQPLFIVNI